MGFLVTPIGRRLGRGKLGSFWKISIIDSYYSNYFSLQIQLFKYLRLFLNGFARLLYKFHLLSVRCDEAYSLNYDFFNTATAAYKVLSPRIDFFGFKQRYCNLTFYILDKRRVGPAIARLGRKSRTHHYLFLEKKHKWMENDEWFVNFLIYFLESLYLSLKKGRKRRVGLRKKKGFFFIRREGGVEERVVF